MPSPGTPTRAARIAFYAPMKPPDHPTPSGDREIARLTMRALSAAGFEVVLASRLRTLDLAGDAEAEARLAEAAQEESARIMSEPARPDLWFTYHCHYKAPDLIGPAVARARAIPYVISEPSLSPKRRAGPWAAFARAAETAIGSADRLFWTTGRDRPALESAGLGARMVHLPAFLDPGDAVAPRAASRPLRLLTVAMMRPGEKLESYRRLARALERLGEGWQLRIVGDGPARAEVEALFAPVRPCVTFTGALDDRTALRTEMEAADLLVWPGVGEGVGMVWLEAQSAGLPVVAEDGPAARDVVAGGRLAPPDAPAAFAAAIREAAGERRRLSAAARSHVEARQSLNAAARTLRAELTALLAERAA